jgi:hypothetical protein
MDKSIQNKLDAVVKAFSLGLEEIERDVLLKLSDAEKLIAEASKRIDALKVQEKENEKKLSITQEKLTSEIKRQETISRQLDSELDKHTKMSNDFKTSQEKIDENLKLSELAKNEKLSDMEKQKKLTQELKDKVIEAEKLKDEAIKKSKENEAEYQRLQNKEAELNGIKNKLERDKLDFSSKENNLEIRVKNIERIEKQMKHGKTI